MGVKCDGQDVNQHLAPTFSKRYGTFVSEEEEGHSPMVREEGRSSGQITLALYWKYIRVGSSWWSILFLILTAILTQASFTGSDYWLQFW